MRDSDKRAIEEIPADAVIQALKCCASEEDNCHRCPFMGAGGISDICITAMSRAALDLIYRKQSEGEWISVEERMPLNFESVLVLATSRREDDGYDVLIAYHDRGEWEERCVHGDGNTVYAHVKYWMPLPEPPDMKGV